MESSRESASAIIGTRYLGTSAANRALRGIEISNFRSGDVFLLLKPEGKLASLLAVTVTPQRTSISGCRWAARFFPCFFWGVFLALLGSSSLLSRWVGGHRVLYVVPAAAVHG